MIFTGQMTKPTVSKTTWNSMYGQLAEQKYVGGKSESQTGNSSRIHFTSEAMKKTVQNYQKIPAVNRFAANPVKALHFAILV